MLHPTTESSETRYYSRLLRAASRRFLSASKACKLELGQWTELQLRLACNLVRLHSLTSSSSVSGGTSEQHSSSHAIALYERVSLLNHSCWPNAMLSFCGQSARVHCLASVGEAVELNISYGPSVGTHSCSDRRTLLQQQYNFECRCVACLQ